MTRLIYIAITSILIYSCGSGSTSDAAIQAKTKDNSSAFNDTGEMSDSNRTEESKTVFTNLISIKLTPFIPNYPDLGVEGAQLLKSRINTAIAKVGFGGDGGNPRFIIGPSINLLSKTITSTAPTKYSNTYEVTLMVCDVASETIFSTYTFEVKGVGDSPSKAFINGFRNLSFTNDAFYKFLEESQQKILQYYELNCESFLTEAKSQASVRNYDAAFNLLNNIPLEAKSCFNKAAKNKEDYFQLQLNNDCQSSLAMMKAELGKANDPSAAGFNPEAMSYYAMIDRSSSCFKEAENIYQKYIKQLNPKAKRDWEFKMQEYQNKIEQIKRNDQFRNDSTMANFEYLKHKDEMQAKAEIEGNKKLLKKYQYDQLPWLRKVFHLGEYDPFDGIEK